MDQPDIEISGLPQPVIFPDDHDGVALKCFTG